MKQKMKRSILLKTIRSKMIAGFAIVLILIGVLAVYNYLVIHKMNNDVDKMVGQDLQLLINDEQMNSILANLIAEARGYVLYGDKLYKENFQSYADKAYDYIDTSAKTANAKEFQELIDQMEAWKENIQVNVFEELEKERVNRAKVNLGKADVEVRALMESFENLATSKEQSMKATGKQVLVDGRAISIIGVIVSAAAIVLGLFVAYFTAIAMTRPIIRVVERMKLVAAGDLSQEPLESKLQDETGQLIEATNTMTRNTRDLLYQIHTVSETVSSQSEELTQAASEVKSGTEQVALTMEELAQGTESQANHTGDLALNMGTFTVKADEANKNGEQVLNESYEVLELANEGSIRMQASTDQMKQIDDIVQAAMKKVQNLDGHTRKISNLVSVIHDIADQTNLLALNAAIEAARAGEHGKGFAVVADEVRKLAEQVSHSVTDITEIVSNIQQESGMVVESLNNGYQEVQEGTTQIQTTNQTFHSIGESIMGMVNHMTAISEQLSDMAGKSQSMNASIEEVASIAEESAAGVEQTSASAEQSSSAMEEVAGSSDQLAKLAEELNGLVGRFKL